MLMELLVNLDDTLIRAKHLSCLPAFLVTGILEALLFWFFSDR